VFERKGRANVYAAVWDPEANGGQGGEVKRSLGHADRDRAKAWADAEVPKLRENDQAACEVHRGPPVVARVLDLYLRHRTRDKGEWQQRADAHHAELWTRVLGRGFDLTRLSRREWDAFLRRRRTGAIDARGRHVPAAAPCPSCNGEEAPACWRCEGRGQINPRHPVAARTVEKDCRWLRAVCRWALQYRDEDGTLLLDRDPTAGLSIPHERNPKRPVASHDRVDAIRAVADRVDTRVEDGGKRRRADSPFAELFEVVVGTGRRVSAVCGLRVEDLELEAAPGRPHGAIVWPADTDKIGKRWRCPISLSTREALDAALRRRRQAGRVGCGPLFPAPGDPEKPLDYTLASSWLRRAEELAGLEPLEGSLWHAYRRLWASARKDLPDVDVAQAGGWSSLDALKQAYQQPDDATMLRVVEHETELREVR
jgi:integrase